MQRLKQPEDLSKKFRNLVFLTVSIVLVFAVSFIKFAPKIGGFFGLISVHRNEESGVAVAVPAPYFLQSPEAVKEKKVTLKGISEPNTTIKLFVNGPEIASVVADSEGKFVFADVKLIDGKNTIYAKAVGKKNVESTKSEVLYIKVDKIPPKVEVISPKSGDTVRNLNKRILVRGKVDEEAQITVNGKLAVTKPDLSFELLINAEEGNVEIKIEAKDTAGNKTEQKYIVRYEKKSS